MLETDLSAQGKACAHSLDPYQAKQNVGLDRSLILFDNLIIIQQKMRKKK